MVVIARQTTWASLQVLTASALNGEFNVVFNAWNNADAGTGLWNNVKISSSAANPMECKSSNTDCEFDIDCTGSSGTPRVSWRRSGSTLFTAGIDGADSNKFKFGTTGLTTNIAFLIPTTGGGIQLPDGSTSAPSVSWINDSNSGWYRIGPQDFGFAITTTKCFEITTSESAVKNGNFNVNGGTTPSLYVTSTSGSGVQVRILASTTSAGFIETQSNHPLVFTTNNSTDILRLDTSKNIVLGSAALGTTATDGFLYIETCAGTPTGVPTAYTGRAATVYDSSNNKLYVYNGAWKGVTLS